MADSKQKKIIEALIARLRTINIANDYETNIGSDVREWEKANVSEDDLEYVCVSESGDIEIDSSSDVWVYDMPVEIEIFLSGSTSPDNARNAVFDVYKCIGIDTNLSGLCDWIIPKSHRIDSDQKAKKITGATVDILIKFQTYSFENN